MGSCEKYTLCVINFEIFQKQMNGFKNNLSAKIMISLTNAYSQSQ